MTQNDKNHNGWTNYETWAVALWLDNDYATHCYWQEVSRECSNAAPAASQVGNGCWTVEEAVRFTLADRLKQQLSDGSPVQEASLYSDLLNAALQEVNWNEIADHLLSD